MSNPAPACYTARMSPTSRREFLHRAALATAGAALHPRPGIQVAPTVHFPTAPRDRISVASYPFREFIQGKDAKAPKPIPLEDFAAHVKTKFNVNKIEPWSG